MFYYTVLFTALAILLLFPLCHILLVLTVHNFVELIVA